MLLVTKKMLGITNNVGLFYFQVSTYLEEYYDNCGTQYRTIV